MVLALRGRAAGEGYQMCLTLVVQLPVTVDLIAALQHLGQSLIGISPLGAKHRAFRYVQSGGYLGRGPALVYLEQNAGPGDCLGRTPARPDHPPQPPPSCENN